MTTEKHTAHVFGAPLTAAEINAPLGQLDAAIVAVEDALAQTALPITTTDATAATGQAVVPVTATTAFLVGQSVWIGDVAGTFETRVILSIQAGVSLTMTANLTNTYAAGKIVSASPSELVEARSTYATLSARLGATGGTAGSDFPGSPVTNELRRRTDRGGALYVWTGAAWRQTNVPSVTAFWGTPTTNDRAYRSDLGASYFYDGARWLSETLFAEAIGFASSVAASGDSDLTADRLPGSVTAPAGLYLVSWEYTFYIAGGTALSVDHRWKAHFKSFVSSAAGVARSEVLINSGASDTWRTLAGSALGIALTGIDMFQVTAEKYGTPGTLSGIGRITYRRIAT